MQGIFKVLVTYKGGEMGYVDLDEVVGKDAVVGAASSKNRTIPLDHDIFQVCSFDKRILIRQLFN